MSGEKFCSNCGQGISKQNNVDNVLNQIQNEEKNTEKQATVSTKPSKIAYIIAFIIIVVFYMNWWFPSSDIDSTNYKYVATAIEYLQASDLLDAPIEQLTATDNNIIYYKDDILVQLSFYKGSLTGETIKSTATFSINRNELITQSELSLMMLDDEWKNAKFEKIDSDIRQKIEEEYL